MQKYKCVILFIIVYAMAVGACATGEAETPDRSGKGDNGYVNDDRGTDDRTDNEGSSQTNDDVEGKDTDEQPTGENADTDDKGQDDSESANEVDTGDSVDTSLDDEFPPCANFDYDKKNYDYGPDYAKGPYGFKGSMCWDMTAGQGTWTNYGDVIHNICLPNQDGEEVCLGEFYDAGYNLLIIEVSAVDCPACAAEARDEDRLIAKLGQSYWKTAWVTIMGRSLSGSLPKISTAASWKNQYGLEGEVLADTNGLWEQRMFFDKWPADERAGVPLTFLVNPANMVIWDAFAGWTDDANFNEFAQYIVDLSVYCSANDLR